MTDPLTDLEARNGIKDFANLVRTFYEALLAEKFSHEEAMILTSTWLAEMTRNAKAG